MQADLLFKLLDKLADVPFSPTIKATKLSTAETDSLIEFL